MMNFFEAFMVKIGEIASQKETHILKPEEEYQVLANLNREKFFSMLSYFASVKSTGVLLLEMPPLISGFLPSLEIHYHTGNIVFLEYFQHGEESEMKKCAQKVERIRTQFWKNYTDEQLYQFFTDMISQKTQYLGGVNKVIQQMSRDQLLKKIFVLAPPVLQIEKEHSYIGEATFCYAMEKWPQKGLYLLKVKFLEKEFSLSSKNTKICVSSLLQMVDDFLA
ncbi:MAG: hypothetical protein HUU50_14460 [Candidatus Brocadiae bacterium]|nr:hypothetical protein [Candidatus Brocadiia bacterium]